MLRTDGGGRYDNLVYTASLLRALARVGSGTVVIDGIADHPILRLA